MINNPNNTYSNISTVDESLAQTRQSIETLVRKRTGLPVKISEVKSLDTLLSSSQNVIASAIYRAIGQLVVNAEYRIDKNAMNHEVASKNGKTSDVGIQKRSGFLQSHLLSIDDGCHHLRNAGWFAQLLPVGVTVSMSKRIGRGVNQNWNMINGQALLADNQNTSDFLYALVAYLDENPHITENQTDKDFPDGKLQLMTVGKRNYDKSTGMEGVKITTLTYTEWRVKALREAEKRQTMALNSIIAKETAEKKKTERLANKEKAETKANLLADRIAVLVEMAENPSITAEQTERAVLDSKSLIKKAS